MVSRETVVAIDPGTEKCGLAVVQRGNVQLQKVVKRIDLFEEVEKAVRNFSATTIVIGDRTGSKEFFEEISGMFGHITIKKIDEHRSSDEARGRYWQDHKPRGLKKLIPTTMQVPPVPIDDYVAVILAERYFNARD